MPAIAYQGADQGTHGREFRVGLLCYEGRKRCRLVGRKEAALEFLGKLEVNVPEDTPPSAVEDRYAAEGLASAQLAEDGHFLRLWRIAGEPGVATAVGLYRADTEEQLDGLLTDLPLYGWMRVTVTALGSHPHDPALTGASLQ